MTGYPHGLAGPPAPPPEPVTARVLGMALKAHRKLLTANAELLTAAGWPTNPRPARSLLALRAELDVFAPHRADASDGMIGDARHAAENGPHGPGSGSDHNGWLKVAGVGVVRAFDITNDPALNLPARAETMRQRARTGSLPQVTAGGYLILNGRITAEDWTGWHAYTGADPHVSHLHVSTSLDPAAFDSTAPWGVFIPEHPPAPPAPPAGPDLTGRGDTLRGDIGATGPRVAAVQGFLNRYAPAYSRLAVDGVYGPATAAVLATFAHNSGIDEADGRNIGPKIAAALHRDGFDTTGAAPDVSRRADSEESPSPVRPSGAAGQPSAKDRVRDRLNRRR